MLYMFWDSLLKRWDVDIKNMETFNLGGENLKDLALCMIDKEGKYGIPYIENQPK